MNDSKPSRAERMTLILLLLTFAASLYLTWRDGFKKGPWMLTGGLFFLWLFYREIQQKE